MRRPIILLLLLASAAPAAPPRFDPIRFFAGRTQGVGRFKAVLHRSEAVRVEGQGRLEPDGTLVLDQLVTRADNAPKPRQWRIRAVAPGRYAGTLSDARGAITGISSGDRLTLRFTSTGGYRVEQVLVLAADGRSARNRLVARRFGLTVATLDEVIRQRD